MPRLFAPLLFLLVVWHSRAHAQDNRVKLCGREFIRMVVRSCGSSRLKRHTQELEQPQVSHHRELLEWLKSDTFNYQEGPDPSREPQDWREEEERNDMGYTPPVQLASTPSPIPDQSKAAEGSSVSAWTLQPGSSRLRRDSGPAGGCCRSGCTMSELVQYC
ncbi:insulin-like 3 (Leydig cell) [Amia ocellicauda]|uniref:insulin-like 3 (Leydig cell) n=1 Tax=Amia ocellicauda TaxID=2972642 RepID=UPI0034645132|nr:REL3 protein [Amia calva]